MSDAGRRLLTYMMLGAGLSEPCEDCNGTGWSKQGWTDKNGFSEDQYGKCRCVVDTDSED